MTEAQARSKIVNIMDGFVGMSRAAMTHKPIIDKYNSHKPLPRGYAVKYSDSYCATTISAAAIQAGYTDIIPIECSCPQMVALAQKMGIWVENDSYIPKPGDILLYDWQDSGVGDNHGTPDHIGMCERIDGNNLVIIEGNMAGGVVGRRSLTVNSKYIRGYICPKYSAKASAEPTASNGKGGEKSVKKIAKEVIAGKWGNGEERRKKLAAAGYSFMEVQTAVNLLLKKK